MRKLIEISLGPRSCKAQVAALLPAFETAIEKKPAGEPDRDAMFAKLKQLGGKQQVAPKAWWQELCHRLIRFIAHTRGVDEIEVVASDEHALIWSPSAWARSVALDNLEPAECQPELPIAFERTPLFANENKRQDKLAVGGREVDPNLLPFAGTLFDSPSFESPGRTRHDSRSWIKDNTAVVYGLLVADLHLDFYSGPGLDPGYDPVDVVLLERRGLGGEIVASGSRDGHKPQDRLPGHERVPCLNLRIEAHNSNEREPRRRRLRQIGQDRLLGDDGSRGSRLFGRGSLWRRLSVQKPDGRTGFAKPCNRPSPIKEDPLVRRHGPLDELLELHKIDAPAAGRENAVME